MTVFFLIQSQDDTSIGPVVLDLVGTVQAYVMTASNSISLNKPLVTKNIRKYGQTLKLITSQGKNCEAYLMRK